MDGHGDAINDVVEFGRYANNLVAQDRTVRLWSVETGDLYPFHWDLKKQLLICHLEKMVTLYMQQ